MAFHNERTEEVGKDGYRVRVPKTASVGQLLEQVRQRVGEAAGTGPLRLLEVRDCRICQVRNALLCSSQGVPGHFGYYNSLRNSQTCGCACGIFQLSIKYIIFSAGRHAYLQPVCRSGLMIITTALSAVALHPVQVFSPEKPVLDLDDHAWTLRAEPVPADEITLAEDEKLLHVYHVTFDESRKKVRRAVGRDRWLAPALPGSEACAVERHRTAIG